MRTNHTAYVTVVHPAQSSSVSRLVRVMHGAALAQAHLDDRQIDQVCTQLNDTFAHLPAVPSRRCLKRPDLDRTQAGNHLLDQQHAFARETAVVEYPA